MGQVFGKPDGDIGLHLIFLTFNDPRWTDHRRFGDYALADKVSSGA
jgi:hypothetical protein